ncbi:LysM peptidoglycan-binding domain-containing protein [Shewanella sp. SG41-4]|uniref:FimV/HubP family polar landmark protein n=1 Tax=Shewanella sp. SG41-4 TaxID=2760976 RepID=UPI00160161AD|nr:FimV/HubP family polar landmark protein [Shewanella sp. SG41-4]MBB1440388.1 LysM peptidoglycan-binding domain-containing protein [Shewanella sp. SG41-4]
MKSFKLLAILALLAVDSISVVRAEVSHISIDTIPFESGQLPQLSVNIITDHHDLSRLTFYLRQIYHDNIVLEKLVVERHDNDIFVLSGTEQIRDPDAALIVSEYRNAKWLQYSPVPLFSKAIAQSKYQPVAIKTMKSASASLTPVPTPINRNTSEIPQVATTQQNLNDCQINPLPNDTLWKIAVRYRNQWNSNIYGAMLALYQTNPSAFYQDKISLLQLGSSLSCPSIATLSRYQNVAVDKITFDNLVASQRGKPQVGKIPTLPLPAAVIATQPISNNDSMNVSMNDMDSKKSESNALLAAIHETKISPQPLPIKTVAKVSIPTHKQDKICLIDKSPQDTLWRVADRYYRQWQISVYGAMLAIYEANPKAFANGKIYLLMSDSRLQCPSGEMLKQYQSASKAQITYEALERTHRQY